MLYYGLPTPVRDAIDWLVFIALVALPGVAGLVAVKLKQLPPGYIRAGLMVFFAGLALPFVYFGFWLLYWLSYRGEVLVLVVAAKSYIFTEGTCKVYK
jgi:hypothetical protein